MEEDAAARKRRGADDTRSGGGCGGSAYVKLRTDRHPRDPPNASGKVEETNDKVATPTASRRGRRVPLCACDFDGLWWEAAAAAAALVGYHPDTSRGRGETSRVFPDF